MGEQNGEWVTIGTARIFVPYTQQGWTQLTPQLKAQFWGKTDAHKYNVACDQCGIWEEVRIDLNDYLSRGKDRPMLCVPCQLEPHMPQIKKLEAIVAAKLNELDRTIAEVLGLQPEAGIFRKLTHEWQFPTAFRGDDDVRYVAFLAIADPVHAQLLAMTLNTYWSSKVMSREVCYAVEFPKCRLPVHPVHLVHRPCDDCRNGAPAFEGSLHAANKAVTSILAAAKRPEAKPTA